MDSTVRRQTLSDLLHRSAKRVPHKIAIQCGATRWTFAEFDDVVDRLAAGLARMDVGKGTPLAVLARNSHGVAALRFALARLGAVLVPINFMLKAEEVAYILRHSGAALMATDSGLAELARSAAALDTQVRQFLWLPSEEPTQRAPDMTTFDALIDRRESPPAVDLKGEDLAQIV